MTPSASPLDTLFETLRQGLTQPPGSDLRQLVPLVRQASAFVERAAEQDAPDAPARASELAHVLAGLLEAGDEAFRLQTFGRCFRLGVQGEVLAVSHMETLPEEQALVILTNLSLEEKLLFANAFLRHPRSGRPRTEAFALGVVGEAMEKSPDDLLLLLDLLASRREYPALPLRNALVRGRLGLWLRQLLQKDLSAEQIRYLARVGGRLRDPGLVEKLAPRLGDLDDASAEAVCRALAETPGLAPEAVADALESLLAADREDSLAAWAVSALARCHEARAGAAAARLLAARPERLAALGPALAGLSRSGFRAGLAGLTPDKRPAVVQAVFRFLAAALPQRVRDGARTVAASLTVPPAVLAALTADLADRAAGPDGPARPAPAWPNPTAGAERAADPAAASLWQRVKGFVGAAEPGDAASAALRRELTAGGELRERPILWKRLDGLRLAGNVFENCVFKAGSLARTDMEGVTFTDCQFEGVDLSEVRLRDVSLTRCRLRNCRLAGAILERVRLVGCELRLCLFGGLTGQNVEFAAVDAAACDFFLARCQGLTLSQIRFRAVSLSRTDMTDVRVGGALFSDCLFEGAVWRDAVFRGVRTQGCYFADTRLDGPTDEPDILGARLKAEARAMAQARPGPDLPVQLSAGPGLRLVAATVEAVLAARDIRRRRRAMLANNKRRLAWARRRFGAAKAAWLESLPGLIRAGLVRDGQELRPAPAARVHGFVPDLPTARRLAGQAGRPLGTLLAVPRDGLRVEAIYAIGSTGSVAQGDASDLDIWICLDPAQAAHPHRAAFQDKLAAIARQAGQEPGLEVHFFVMTAQDVRDNRFGFSADEGYGSAQGRLLKEEFYRTALCLAGKKPAWWLSAPGLSAAGQARAAAELARLEPEAAADSLDCGALEPIAGDEFVGASLWMLVKSFSDPFKSVMKLGLLEKYAAEQGQGQPAFLCETLKAFVCADQGGLWRCDPYALLFGAVSRHYGQHHSPGILELLRRAFQQKTGLDPFEEYLSRSGEAVLDHFFPYAPAASGTCPPAPKRHAPAEEADFSRALALGQAVATYLRRAAQRLKAHGATLPTDGGLSPRDQTMLSRRIAANFSQAAGKIPRLPLLRPGQDLFAALTVDCRETADQGRLFCARGQAPSPARQARSPKLVRQDGSLVRLAAWLVANTLYAPGLFLRAGSLPAPLTLPEVTALFTAVHAAFPIQATFAPPLSWGLAPRRITAALLVGNLLTPREEKKLLELDVLYATSWGELFHARLTDDLQTLAGSPALLLADSLGLPLDPTVRLAGFVPARSLCRALAETIGAADG